MRCFLQYSIVNKTTQNHRLPELLPPVLADDGVVLVLQNGLGVERDAAAVVGDDRVLGGLCFLCSNKVGPGEIHHLDYGQIKLGHYRPDDRPAGITEPMRQVAADFEAAGIGISLADDLVLARWQKLVWNVPFNGLTVVLDATTDRLVRDPAARPLVERLMQEVAEGARAAAGRTIAPAFLEKMVANTERMTPYRPSMKIDYDEGRPMEVEAIFGAPCRAAAAAGVELPRLAMLYAQLDFLDRQRRESSSQHAPP